MMSAVRLGNPTLVHVMVSAREHVMVNARERVMASARERVMADARVRVMVNARDAGLSTREKLAAFYELFSSRNIVNL